MEELIELNFLKKKKKKSKHVSSPTTNNNYHDMLKRLYNQLDNNNNNCKINIKIPRVIYENKKTIIINFNEIFKNINREITHLLKFFSNEFGTTLSIDSNYRLIIKGKFNQQSIQKILKNYYTLFIICKSCKHYNTILKKENGILFIICLKCEAKNSINY